MRLIVERQKLTLSVFTADVGGFVGHVSSHPDILDTAKERLYIAREKGFIVDFHVLRCGDDLELIITHRSGCANSGVHELVWNTFNACKEVSMDLGLYAHDRGLSSRDFTGSVKLMGPGAAEVEFMERGSEPVLVLMSNKTSTGSWNLPVYRVYADPFNTSGLVLDPSMAEGFSFTVLDIEQNSEITLQAPKELHSLLALIGSTSRYVVTSVRRNTDNEIACVVASQKLNMSGERAASKCEPAVIMRCHDGLPSVGEAMEAFAHPYLVEGWMRGAHTGPLMPVPFYEANPTRFEGPPRAIGAGFQITDGRLIGPHDMFDDPSFDETRRVANNVTDYLRRHGPFQPHRMSWAELERTGPSPVADKLKERFEKL
ncbi:MAG: fructose 1,6-bisphosphatase [Deltaproteobacteria bacterium]|nr:fructose 1,6-bisphosphatase [Deltaproteobacteria bacterium]